MKKTKRIISLSFFLLVLFSFSVLAVDLPGGAKVTCDNNNHLITKGDNSISTNDAAKKWDSAIKEFGVPGKTWIGKLNSNGPNDNSNRLDTGRNTIIFVPCYTDFTKPIELVYFFHGLNGFDVDMEQRLAPQMKIMSQEDHRNIVLFFPELPWSKGTKYGARKKTMLIWKEGDSNARQLHDDAINIIRNNFAGNFQPGFISMTGHSAGGSALKHLVIRPSLENNAINYIKPNKITLSDADYGWTLGQKFDYGKKSVTQTFYDYYISNNPNVELNLLVEDPSVGGAHQPTFYAINFIKYLGVDGWFANQGSDVSKKNWNEGHKGSYQTDGAVKGQVFKVPGHSNINYVPLNLKHEPIGAMSLAWSSGNAITSPPATVSPTPPSPTTQPSPTTTPTPPTSTTTSPSSTTPQPGQQSVSKVLPKSWQEIDQVWSKNINGKSSVGMLVRGNNQIYAPSSPSDPNPWKDFNDVYYEISTVPQSTPPPTQPSPTSTTPPISQPSPDEVTPGSTGASPQPPSPPGSSPLPPSSWNDYQNQVGATANSPGIAGGETFSGLIVKTVSVDKPNYNNQQPSGKWTITLNPGQSCPNNICLNDITPKSKKTNNKQGVMIHATVGNDYLGLTKSWSKDYWENQGGLIGHTHYIFGRDGNYAQHASEFADIWHSKSGSEDPNIPNPQIDANTIAIEVANAMYECKGICHRDSRTYKGKTATECGQEDCMVPLSLWNDVINYLPQSDLTHGNVKKKLIGKPIKYYEKFADTQLKGLVKLVTEIMIRHNMHIDNLVRHSDNTWRGSGSTHTDPGPMFDWMGFRKSVCQGLNQYYGTELYDCNNLNTCGGC